MRRLPRVNLWRMLVLGWLLLANSSTRVLSLPTPRQGIVMAMSVSSGSLNAMGSVWYYQYGYHGDELEGHQRVYMVRPGYSSREVARILRERPGRWWLVGNEPNDPFQDALSPTAFAIFYHQFSNLAHRVDSSSRLAVGGFANADVVWAQMFVEAYAQLYGHRPYVDAWSIHCYILEPEHEAVDTRLFRDRIESFADWVSESDYAGSPLFLTEYGVLDPKVDLAATARFCEQTTLWLHQGSSVSSWAWFCSNSKGEFGGDLFNLDLALTQCGEAYRNVLNADQVPRCD